MYFIINGQVEIYHKNPIQQNSKKVRRICIYESGDLIGLKRFFANEELKYSARSVDKCNILAISIADFTEVLKDFPEDYE